jgi:hypothetical protein
MRTFDVQRGDKFTKGETTYRALDFECYPIIFELSVRRDQSRVERRKEGKP